MILDVQALFSDAQVLNPPGATAPNVSTNVLDMFAARDLGKGERLFVAVQVAAIVNAPTLQFIIVGSDDSAGLVNRIVEYSSPTTSPAAGTMLRTAIPANPQNPKRFYRIEYALGGGTGTAATAIFTVAAGATSTYSLTVDGITVSVAVTYISDAETAARIANAINAHPQVSQLVFARANVNAAGASAVGVVSIIALATGTNANAITTTAVSGTGFTAGAATMSGGAGAASTNSSATVTAGFVKDEQATFMT